MFFYLMSFHNILIFLFNFEQLTSFSMSEVFVSMSSSALDKNCSTNIYSLDFSMKDEFVSMSRFLLKKKNSSQDFCVEEESTSS